MHDKLREYGDPGAALLIGQILWPIFFKSIEP